METCQWFALCTNPATTTEPHPILGAVPICDRCQAKAHRLRDEVDQRGGGRQAQQSRDANRMGRYTEGGRDV